MTPKQCADGKNNLKESGQSATQAFIEANITHNFVKEP